MAGTIAWHTIASHPETHMAGTKMAYTHSHSGIHKKGPYVIDNHNQGEHFKKADIYTRDSHGRSEWLDAIQPSVDEI
jgi:hypothetical protein